jgi:hypothetical protein
MKYLKLFSVIIFLSILIYGCTKSSSVEPNQNTVDISGEWKGYLLLDGLGNDASSDSSFILIITQNKSMINSTLKIPNEYGIEPILNFQGEIEEDSTFTLENNNKNTEIKIYGKLESDHSLQVSLSGINDVMQFIVMFKDGDLEEGSFFNKYKLDLKLGTVGNGRSIILVHGMDDNANSWDDMIQYFREHNIDKTNNVWVFEYKWWRHISDNGQIMADTILTAQANNQITQDPIIVAHSMGGLVARSYITKVVSSVHTNFYRLITLSTPHYGSNLAHFVPFGDCDGIGDLIPGHDFLNSLNSNQYEISQRSKYWVLNGRIGTYPSCYHLGIPLCYHWHHPHPTLIEKTGHGILHKPNDGMVTNLSARFDDNGYYETDHNVHRIDTFEWINHSYLNKDSRVCAWVTDFIKDHQ